MGADVIHMCCILAGLCTSLCSAAPVSDSPVVSVQSSVLVHRGHTTTLPCWLSPSKNAEGLEVRWYRDDHFDTPIIFNPPQSEVSQEALYKDRVSFGLKDAGSGGLKTGDVSLRLVNVTIEDAGDYTCYISSDQGYDKGIISLSVIETGTSPFLSVGWKDGNLVNVSCESAGWYPQPQLRWSNQKEGLNPGHLTYSNSPSGLMSVHSWLLVSSSSEVSCSVGLSVEEKKVARVHLGNPPPPAKDSSAAGWVAFALLLISILALAGLLYFKKRDLFSWKKDEPQSDKVDGKELTEPLLNYVPTAFTEAKEHYVNVTLAQAEHPYLFIKGCKVRDKNIDFPDGPKVTCLTAIRGQSLSSGQHYWEVSLGNVHAGLKKSWWLGVTSAADFSYNISPTTSNGFWFLSCSPESADSFQFNTEPKVFLPVLQRPQTVGVYLNCDSGELSFYNVDNQSLIGSLTFSFSGQVFPFFNPGKYDTAPMEILHQTVQGENSDMVNSVE